MALREPLAVLVAYHNTPALERAIDSLGPYPALFVVDNGADPTVRALVGAKGGRYIAPGVNIGFAAAVNLALSERDGRDVLLLNPDARVSPDLPGRLANALEEDGRVAAVAPVLLGEDGRRERVEWPIPSPSQEWIDALRLRRFFPAKKMFLVGAVLLLRSEALDDVGEFDERYFLYAEEADWQLRALRRGWSVKVASEVVAHHEGAGSSDDESVRSSYFYASAAKFGLKWYGRRGWAVMRAGSRFGTLLRFLASVGDPVRRARYSRELRL